MKLFPRNFTHSTGQILCPDTFLDILTWNHCSCFLFLSPFYLHCKYIPGDWKLGVLACLGIINSPPHEKRSALYWLSPKIELIFRKKATLLFHYFSALYNSASQWFLNICVRPLGGASPFCFSSWPLNWNKTLYGRSADKWENSSKVTHYGIFVFTCKDLMIFVICGSDAFYFPFG